MLAAPLPANEVARLAALHRYAAVDRSTQRAFDSIVALVANICRTPIALVSMVDEARQVFYARIGIDASETPRNISFCGHAIADAAVENGLFLVADALRDARFRDNPLVVGAPNIRFYGGAPLMTHDGYAIGTLCVIDAKPRVLSPDQCSALRLLGDQVVALMELSLNRRELLEARDQAERSAKLACEARDVANRANAAKSSFLAHISHEIRTPMNGIMGTVEILQDTRLTTLQRDCINTISTSAEVLVGTVSNVLDLAKIEAGAVVLEAVELEPGRLAREVSSLFHSQATSKGIDLIVRVDESTPPFLIGDTQRLRQVLTNLVANAIKFTARGSVTIELSGKVRDASTFLLCARVSDTGIGIPDARKSAVFAPFVQADASTTRRFGGTGLGLSISRGLVEMMNGSIGIEGREGEGSSFWFEVPLEVSRAARPTPGKAPVAARTFDVSILLADDEPTNRLVARRLLEKLGCRVDMVDNGEEALQRYVTGSYELVLMDLHMPVLDGFGATRAMRAAEKGSELRIPIIALTASVDGTTRDKAIDAGVDDLITKPLRTAQLVRILDQFTRACRGC